MSETPKQRIRKILDSLPLDEDARRAFEEMLEQVTEEDCGDILYVYDGMLEENPDLLDEVIEALEHYRDSDEEP